MSESSGKDEKMSNLNLILLKLCQEKGTFEQIEDILKRGAEACACT